MDMIVVARRLAALKAEERRSSVEPLKKVGFEKYPFQAKNRPLASSQSRSVAMRTSSSCIAGSNGCSQSRSQRSEKEPYSSEQAGVPPGRGCSKPQYPSGEGVCPGR